MGYEESQQVSVDLALHPLPGQPVLALLLLCVGGLVSGGPTFLVAQEPN